MNFIRGCSALSLSGKEWKSKIEYLLQYIKLLAICF